MKITLLYILISISLNDLLIVESQNYPDVSIRAKANNKYVSAENGGASPLVANRDSVNTWETFQLILNDDYSVSFRSKANGLFVTADNYGNDSLIANRQLNQGWERFIMTPQPDGSYSLESKANWKFISVDPSASSNKQLIANRIAASTWESFFINFNPFSKPFPLITKPIEFWQSNINQNRMLIRLKDLSFKKNTDSNPYTIYVNENIKYQQIDGFGASLTDSAAWLLNYQLNSTKRSEIMEKLFGLTGIGISLLRQTIGSSDFAWENWSFNDNGGQDDFNLNSFSLWREDAYIRPMLNQALQVSNGKLKIFASPWSPPAWMKTKKNLIGSIGGSLRSDCYDVYANYFVKYIQQNLQKGTKIYAITVQNEPMYAPPTYPGMLMSPTEQINFINNNLSPKLKNAGLNTKIIVYDHNYGQSIDYPLQVSKSTQNNIAGAGFHHYIGDHDAESYLLTYKTQYPSKDIWMTECGFGTWMGDNNSQFQIQMERLIKSSRYWSKGLIMWNIALDQNSQPAVISANNGNKGLLTIRSDKKDSVTFESGYYSLGHFSKFVQPNAYRISSNTFHDDVENVAFLNPDNTVVVVISSRTNVDHTVKINWRNQSFDAFLPAFSSTTLKFSA